MNAAQKRELLGTLRLDLPELTQNRAPRRDRYQIAVIVAACAVSAWLATQWDWVNVIPEAPFLEAPTLEQTAELEPVAAIQPTLMAPTKTGQKYTTPERILLQANGYVIASQSATVSARTTAVVKAVHVDAGDSVKAGALLAQLDDRLKRAEYELAVSKQEGARILLAKVEAELVAARRRLSRVSALTKSQLASVAEFDEASTRVELLEAQLASLQANVEIAIQQVHVYRVALADFEIRAPFDGVVTERSAQPGEIVSPVSAGGGFTRTGIATLVNMDSLEIEVEVNELYIREVQPRHLVEVVLTAYPDITYSGQVIAIIPRGNRSKGTVKVRIKLKDSDPRVLPEMGARVDFLSL